MNINVRKINDHKEEYMNLLLEADPDRDVINQYIEDGELYVLIEDNEVVCEAVIVKKDNNICELKNIATVEGKRGHGYAKKLIKYLINEYKGKYSKMIVGTTENNIPFYVKCGFDKYYKTVKNFFVDNYKEEIWDNKLHCIDMYYYYMELPPQYHIEKIDVQDRNQVNQILIDEWESTDIIVRGNIIDGTKLNGFLAKSDKNVIGLVTYLIYENKECEIISLNSFKENIGIGTELIEKVKNVAIESKCNLLKLVTTNDNVEALKFYQKRGFTISNIYNNAIEESRKLKPEIPLYAENEIPIRDEIELRMEL